METLIALICFALSLVGIDIGGNHFIERSNRDGVDLLYSRVDARPGMARFQCLRSASGQCHYTLFPRECVDAAATATQGAANCLAQPIRQFAVVAGGERELDGLPAFHPCVAQQPARPAPDCASR
jgi:hypothetical protein